MKKPYLILIAAILYLTKDVYDGLTKIGLNVWFDKIALKIGSWKTQIERAISKRRYFVVCISEAALKKTGDEPSFQGEELNSAYNIVENQAPSSGSRVRFTRSLCSLRYAKYK